VRQQSSSYHLRLSTKLRIRDAKKPLVPTTGVVEDAGKKEPSYTAGGNAN
jgi:hypothetical protein